MTIPSQPVGTYVDSKGEYRNPHTQQRKEKPVMLYLWCLFRLVVTMLLIGGVAVTLRGFEAKGALTKTEKYVFNTATILFTLVLGINITIAHSQVVHFIREGIINRRSPDRTYWQTPQFKKISGLRTTLSFLLHILSPKTASYPGGVNAASIFLSVWFISNLAVAIIIALIGLTYSLDDGAVGHRPGNVSIPNTEWFFLYKKDNEDPDIFSQRFVSRLYTDISISYPDKTPKDPGPDDEYQVEELDDGWRYNFRQSDPSRKVVTRTNRYIKTSATCEAFHILQFDLTNTSDIVYSLGDGTTATIQELLVGNGTTYISQVNDIYDYGSDLYTCGDRCGELTITQIEDVGALRDPWLYICQSTVHEVEGATLPEESISDPMAVIAATSMSQSGYSDYLGGLYGHYPDNVRLGLFADGDPKVMEKLVSRGSVGCIAAMDQMNPRVHVPGTEPWVGVQLNVRWWRITIVLAVIFVIQLVFSASAAFWYHINSTAEGSQPQSTHMDPLLDPTLMPSSSKERYSPH